MEIYNTSSPNKVDIVEIPYNKFGYDRENAVYILIMKLEQEK